jgi:hypothetical protein
VALPLPRRICGAHAHTPRFAHSGAADASAPLLGLGPPLSPHTPGSSDSDASEPCFAEHYGACGDGEFDTYPYAYEGEPGGELTWLGAGVRVGVGVGLGVCLGLGLGVGILVSSYQRATRKIGMLKEGGLTGLLK